MWRWFANRVLRRARLWSIADMPDGTTGRIVGVVRAVDERRLTAPVSQRGCVYYAAEAFEIDGVRAREAEGVTFELEDGTGTATIDPRGARSVLATARYHNGVFSAPTQPQIAFLEKFGYRGSFLDMNYREAVLAPGDRIGVLGIATRGADGRLRLATSPEMQLVLGNDRRATRLAIPAAKLRVR